MRALSRVRGGGNLVRVAVALEQAPQQRGRLAREHRRSGWNLDDEYFACHRTNTSSRAARSSA